MSKRKVEVSIDIKRSFGDVHDFLDDSDNDPLWQTSVLESCRNAGGAIRVGTVYHVKAKFLGRLWKQDWEVIEHDADEHHWKSRTTSGPLQMQAEMRYSEIEGGVRVTRSLEVDVGHFFKLAGPVVERTIKREFETDLEILKDILENQD
ncbi:MAG: SRPBCC family protein [Mariprofundaceae bacterium]|nr:SRPBCC family protein [Mariprofundaceae bacterium]